MEEIPAEFGPAWMNVVFTAPDAKQAVDSVTLRLGGHVTTLPACIVALLPSRKMAQVRASASWYHRNAAGRLPDYLSLRFAAPKAVKAGQLRTHVGIMVNLRTAKIININKIITGPAEGEQRGVSERLLQGCSAQELDAVFDPAYRLSAR